MAAEAIAIILVIVLICKIIGKKGSASSSKNVVSVKYLGVTSQCIDNKYHAILNYEEEIYANVYSFFVTYKNGVSKTVQVYKENDVQFYMGLANKCEKRNEVESNNVASESNSKFSPEKLELLKSLHDKGAIPDDVFEEKKKEMLSNL